MLMGECCGFLMIRQHSFHHRVHYNVCTKLCAGLEMLTVWVLFKCVARQTCVHTQIRGTPRCVGTRAHCVVSHSTGSIMSNDT